MIDTFLQIRLTDTRIKLKFMLSFSYDWHLSSTKVDWHYNVAQIYVIP